MFEDPPLRLRRCRHGPMLYLQNDFIGRSLDAYGEYCEAELTVLGDLLRPGMVAVDVGANIGVHAVFMDHRVGRTGAVIAVEPQRPIHQLLCANLALNRLSNVQALHAACGSEAGTVIVPPVDYGAAGAFNFGALELRGWTAGEAVAKTPLDALGLTQCALVKIDVEGMELAVLVGAEDTIRRCRPALYVENNRPDDSPRLLDWLLAADYRPYWHVAPYFSATNFFGEAENQFPDLVAVNVVCFPREQAVEVQGLREVRDPSSWWTV